MCVLLGCSKWKEVDLSYFYFAVLIGRTIVIFSLIRCG